MRHIIKGEGAAVNISVVTGDETPAPPTEISVIVRDLAPGWAHEVRHVRPGDIVMGANGIDWDATPYVAYTLVVNEDVQPAA